MGIVQLLTTKLVKCGLGQVNVQGTASVPLVEGIAGAKRVSVIEMEKHPTRVYITKAEDRAPQIYEAPGVAAEELYDIIRHWLQNGASVSISRIKE